LAFSLKTLSKNAIFQRESRLINLFNMYMMDWLTAEKAMEQLGVRAQTLYAYVSRGQIYAEPDPDDPRRSRYRGGDVQALTVRKARGRKAASVAQGAIAWGEPVLTSSITTVAHGRLYYRGLDAVTLASSQTFEGVARLLRNDDGVARRHTDRPRPPEEATMRGRAFAALAQRAAQDPPATNRSAADLACEGATLLDILADAVIGAVRSGPIHERLGRAWGCGHVGCDLIRRALILLADHELNASTFAARVAASTGASLAAACLAGLATLSGPLHGGLASRVRLLAAEARQSGPEEAVAARLAHWPSAPGFGHPLYPDGDPRARALLDGFEPPQEIGELGRAAEEVTGEAANVDFALVALAEALNLPDDAPFAMFAIARCAGWTAHAIEQIGTGSLIRPRARYAGPAPSADRPQSGDRRQYRAD
jgi:citrate synthase